MRRRRAIGRCDERSLHHELRWRTCPSQSALAITTSPEPPSVGTPSPARLRPPTSLRPPPTYPCWLLLRLHTSTPVQSLLRASLHLRPCSPAERGGARGASRGGCPRRDIPSRATCPSNGVGASSPRLRAQSHRTDPQRCCEPSLLAPRLQPTAGGPLAARPLLLLPLPSRGAQLARVG